MYFPSKRDRWLGAILAVPMVAEIAILVATFESGRLAEGVVVFLALGAMPSLLVAWLWFGTGYRIAGDQLEIRSGPFFWRIPLASIKRVQPSRSIAAGPALSLDRLQIIYGTNQSVLISPAAPAAFLEALKRERPAVEVAPGRR